MSQPKIPLNKMPGRSVFQMPEPLFNITLSPEIFEQQIKSQGIRMIHARPVPCPNVRELNSGDHVLNCSLCHNGYIYYSQAEFVGTFFGNDLQRQFNLNGTWDMDQASIVIPVRDNQEKILDVQYFDQILIPDITVRYYQRIEHSQSGIDRAQFAVFAIDFAIDNKGKMYRPGVDLVADEGRIKWIGERPGYDLTLNRGHIYSVNYYTNPVFTVIGLPHQIRMAQTQVKGEENVQARFPQLCIVRKDFIPFDSADKTGPSDRPEPTSGSFV